MFVTKALAQTETPPAATPHVVDPAQPALHNEVGTAAPAHEGRFPPMEPQFFPSQILWLAISFGLFYLILKRVILPRLGAIIENRRDRIALDIEAAHAMKSDADAAQAAYQQELTSARERSHKIAAAAREAAKIDADAQMARINADLDARLDAAQARIADIKSAALADVGEIAEGATQSILNALIGLDASSDEVSGAVRSVRS